MGMFEADAQALYEAQPADVRAVADMVNPQDDGEGTLVFTLAVTPGYEPPHRIERHHGVMFQSGDGSRANPREYTLGIRAMGLRIRMRLLADDTLQAWVKREARARGGNAALARALLGRPDAPAKDKAYKAQIRKIQEWEQAKYKRATGANAERVARLRAERTVQQEAFDIIEGATRRLVGITGTWLVSNDQNYDRIDAADEAVEEVVRSHTGYRAGGHYQGEEDAKGVLLGELDWAAVCENAGTARYRIRPELLVLNGLHAEVTR